MQCQGTNVQKKRGSLQDRENHTLRHGKVCYNKDVVVQRVERIGAWPDEKGVFPDGAKKA